MARTVMVVEDDVDIRLVLRTFLSDEGYRVLEAGTGEQGLELFGRDPADVVLVDLRLPGMHGLDVVRTLRRSGSSVTVIVVTAQADSHDVVAGLEAGADDYVTKPFVPKELSARIRAQLRKAGGGEHDPAGDRPADRAPAQVLVSGDLEVRPDTAEVFRAGRPLTLSRTEFRVLIELLEARGRVLSRDELLRKVWGYGNAGDGRVVDNLIYRLRSKLEDDPADPSHLVTVRGFGYRLRA